MFYKSCESESESRTYSDGVTEPVLVWVLQALLDDPVSQDEDAHDQQELKHLEEHLPDHDHLRAQVPRDVEHDQRAVSHEHERKRETDLRNVQLSRNLGWTDLLAGEAALGRTQLQHCSSDKGNFRSGVQLVVQVLPPLLEAAALETVVRHDHLADLLDQKRERPDDEQPVQPRRNDAEFAEKKRREQNQIREICDDVHLKMKSWRKIGA